MIDRHYKLLIDDILAVTKAVRDTQLNDIKVKSQLDFVTNIDIALDKAITEIITKQYANDLILSEENWSIIAENKPDALWVVDPLDGTSNVISSVPFSSCSIARIENNKVVFGLVIDLLREEIFYAQLGKGAYLNNEKLNCQPTKTSFLGISTGFIKQAGSGISKLTDEVKFRLLGSQALHLCYVAASRFRATINLESKIWDDIAGALIVTEAGGCFTSLTAIDLDNCQTWYNKTTVSALAYHPNDIVLAKQIKELLH